MPKYSHSWLNERGQLILLGGGIAGLLFLMYLLQHLINPLGYALLIGIVLYPIRKQPVARALLYAILGRTLAHLRFRSPFLLYWLI